MSNYNFTNTERRFIDLFLDAYQKVVHWKEYGSAEWYIMSSPRVVGEPTMLPTTPADRRIIRMMVKLGLFVPEIENDKEYAVQRALGVVIGRIYYIPDEIREDLKMG